MQRSCFSGACSSISLLRLARLKLCRGRIPCVAFPPGLKCTQAMHSSAMSATTEHSEGPKNKLALSPSPYLQQHATNPVPIEYLFSWDSFNLVALGFCSEDGLIKHQAFEVRFRLIGTPGVTRPSIRLAEKTNPFFSLSATAHATGTSLSSPNHFIPLHETCKHGFTHMHLTRLPQSSANACAALCQADTVKEKEANARFVTQKTANARTSNASSSIPSTSLLCKRLVMSDICCGMNRRDLQVMHLVCNEHSMPLLAG